MKFFLSILVIIGNLNVLLANNDNCRENDLNALMVRLRALRTDFADLKIKHEELINRIDLINGTQVVLKEANDNQESELEKLRKEINKTSSDLKTENRKQDTELTKLRTEIDAIKGGKVVAFTVNTPKMGASAYSLIFATFITNEGNAFDTSTGKFTCPVSGFYYFSLHIVIKQSSSVGIAGCYIKLNELNAASAYTRPYSGNGSYEVSTSVYLKLKVGDVVRLDTCSFGIYSRVEPWSSFSGHLEQEVY